MAKSSKKRGVAQPPAPHHQSGAPAAAAQHAPEAWLSPDVGQRLAIVAQVREGFPFQLVGTLAQQSGVALEELVELGVIPRRTWAHSKQNQRFTPTQSARVVRFFRVLQKARDTFGPEAAMHWLKRPTKPLQENAPVGLLDTEEGARLVEDLLVRIEHGIAA